MLNIDDMPESEAKEEYKKILGDFKWFASIEVIVARKAPPDVQESPMRVAVHDGVPLGVLTCMAECLTHLCAQRSSAGYEATLDAIRAGAMTYRKPKS